MLDCVVVGREDAQFALGAVDRLFIALVRELDGNLTITRPMRDEKRTVILSTTPSRHIEGAQAMKVSIIGIPNTHITGSQ